MNISVFRRLFPFSPVDAKGQRDSLRPDLEAGLIGAILILPQAIALATLAGMPPVYGIYTSILPVIIASLWGSSSHTVSGPNTAICVLILLSVTPFAAAGTPEYINLVLGLTLMAGLIQLVIGLFQAGAILDFISQTVISAVILAVGLIILVSSTNHLFGIASGGQSFITRVIHNATHLNETHLPSASIGIISIMAGLIARRFYKRYALVIALVAGTLAYTALMVMRPELAESIPRLGKLDIGALPFSAPDFTGHMAELKSLLPSAASIAFLGLMQTVVISRSIAAKTGQRIDVNQESTGQGIANIVAPFVSGFAGSGSFNRSAANLDSGARTKLAAVIASVVLGVIVIAGNSLLAWLPDPAIAAVLILVGIGMVDLPGLRRILRARNEAFVFFITFTGSLGFGLNTGVLAGVLSALIIYLWLASTPNVHCQESLARDGRRLVTVTIDGGLFFGSVHSVEQKIPEPDCDASDPAILLVHTDHLTYLDIPGATMLASVAKRWRECGGDCYVFITRDNILRSLELSGLTDVLGRDALIFQDRPHPVKDILYPYQITGSDRMDRPLPGSATHTNQCDMDALAKRLRTTRLFGALSPKQIDTLLAESETCFSATGDILIDETEQLEDHILLIAGTLEAQRTWRTAEGDQKSHTWLMQPRDKPGSFVFMGASTRHVRVRAITDVRHIRIDADQADRFISWVQQVASEISDDPVLQRRVELVSHVSAFSHLPLGNISTALKRFSSRIVEAGETIITEGEKGDAYYVIEDGQARVIRTDPFSDETAVVAMLNAGDAFGEEALLQGGYRNATVEMITPGSLLVMQKEDFDKLLEPGMTAEIDAESAHARLASGKVGLIDCRYDMEFEESRIPGATHIALDRLRWDIHNIDPEGEYIVYCRSGRRSLAAAFLLSERNIRAKSLTGGIKNWPYEIDEALIEATDSGS